MDGTAHGAKAFIVYHLLFYLIWHTLPLPIYSLLIILFGNLPDFDSIYWHFKGGKFDNHFQHHLYFWSHWPIAYLPVVILTLIAFLTHFLFDLMFVAVFGIYMHLIADTACCGDGMMWGKVPWKKDQFAIFYNFFSSKTDGYHGSYWTARWRTTLMFQIGRIEGIIIIFFLIWLQIIDGLKLSYLVVIVFFIGNILTSFRSMDVQFLQEPPNGRYDDYRKHKGYLTWMEKNGYGFNSNMHAIRKK
jgi:hypothetical protein